MPLKVNFLISHQTQPECQKTMSKKEVIPYTDTCNYLGNTITDMTMRLNHLLAEFSHCDSDTLSTLTEISHKLIDFLMYYIN